jgi:ankyrin repeat protein
LNELPRNQEDAYKQILQRIPGEIQLSAYRLLQCLVAAIRPLRIEELAQILTVDFNPDPAYTMVEDWRSGNAEEEVLSACSSLISIISDNYGQVIQLSHTSVKSFLTSDSFRTSDLVNGFHYHTSLDDAHMTLAQACLAVLLQLDEETEKMDITGFPLLSYAARHWVDHAKFGTVASRSQIRDAMRRLFETKDPYFDAWIRARGVDERGERVMDHLTGPEVTRLYCAGFFGFREIAQYFIVKRRQDVNTKCSYRGTALHAASGQGHLDVARLLLEHRANPNPRDGRSRIPLQSAFDGGHLDIMELLLQYGADVDAQDGNDFGLLHDASYYGREDAVRLLLRHKADMDALGSLNQTPVHLATGQGYTEIVRLLLENGANVNATDSRYNTPLDDAEREGFRDIVELLQSHGATSRRHELNHDRYV